MKRSHPLGHSVATLKTTNLILDWHNIEKYLRQDGKDHKNMLFKIYKLTLVFVIANIY